MRKLTHIVKYFYPDCKPWHCTEYVTENEFYEIIGREKQVGNEVKTSGNVARVYIYRYK